MFKVFEMTDFARFYGNFSRSFFFLVLFGHMDRDVSFVSDNQTSNCTTWLSILFTCHLPFIHVQNIEEFQVRIICKNSFGQFLPAQFLFLSFFFFLEHLAFVLCHKAYSKSLSSECFSIELRAANNNHKRKMEETPFTDFNANNIKTPFLCTAARLC